MPITTAILKIDLNSMELYQSKGGVGCGLELSFIGDVYDTIPTIYAEILKLKANGIRISSFEVKSNHI